MASPTRMKFFKETNCNQKNYFCSPNGKIIALLANSCWSTKTVFASFQIGVPFWSTSHIFSVFRATNYAYVRGTLQVIPHIWYSGDLNTGLLIRFRSWMYGDLNVRDLNVWGPECLGSECPGPQCPGPESPSTIFSCFQTTIQNWTIRTGHVWTIGITNLSSM